MKTVLMAGVSRRDITPPIGTALFGYMPDLFSDSVHDPLNATALCLAQDDTKVLILSIDNGLIANELCHRIRTELAALTAIPYDHIILSVTHTHSAPNICGMRGWGEIDISYCETVLMPALHQVAVEAASSLVTVRVGFSVTESKVGINRRQILENGDIALGQNPDGQWDPRMTLAAIVTEEGKPLANIVHYGCHGTSCGCHREITRDWMGVMCDRLEKESGALTLFLNGAEGDIGPRLSNGFTTGDITHVLEIGGVAAQDAVRAWRSVKEFREELPLRVLSDEIRLPYRPLPSREAVEEKLAAVKAPETLINIERLEYQHLLDVKEVYDRNLAIPSHFTFRQTVLALGPMVLVPFPFEIFVGVTLRLRDYSPFAYTLSLSNCNGANSYFPTQDQICRGGYEVRSFVSGNAFTLTDDAEQHILNENLRLLRRL